MKEIRQACSTMKECQLLHSVKNLLAVLKQPNAKLNKYVKYDPFLNLYLVRTDFSLIPTPMGDEEKLTRNDWVGNLGS